MDVSNVVKDGFNERIAASWGASAAARIFFARVCFATHRTVANFHDEANPWAHVQQSGDYTGDCPDNATVIHKRERKKQEKHSHERRSS